MNDVQLSMYFFALVSCLSPWERCTLTGVRFERGCEHCACAEAAQRSAVLPPGWGTTGDRWSHQGSRWTCRSVRRSTHHRLSAGRTSKHIPEEHIQMHACVMLLPLYVCCCCCCCCCRIGVSEKGSATVKLTVTTAPGHSSMPPRESSIGILAAAVKRSFHVFILFLFHTAFALMEPHRLVIKAF